MARAGALGGLGAAGLLALLAGCQPEAEAPKLPEYKGPLLQTENVITLISDSARPHIRLTGPLKQQYESGDVLYPKGARVLFYDKTGKLLINTIDANWAKRDNARQLYVLRGNVRVANVPQQQKLNTEELFYDQSKQLIYTDRKIFVRVETPTEVLTGYGLTANQDFSRYSIYKPLGTFTLEEARAQGK
ncbi:LPS export ABC transporter periplasmic protein LptC [Hymenobacter sp. RP-2-7]|uniref:LPS export ABC transporter periplasmic protein LptC n=1 Tax=Hymenobacter polaris TaxID=2682546 RepID=A0A7Y0FNG6_9BACT|nr:LPS export ABC transporter periplasmic protein LptC [Hymenobacter polaris]NML66883.1 LPS export ABC transporter periplasmic protein LptC [Hymenobacter polaris]